MMNYRAWDSRKKKYLYADKEKPIWTFLRDIHLESVGKSKTMILEECIERTDWVGNKIYVGDVVVINLFGHQRIGQVIYLKEKSCYGILQFNNLSFLPFIDYPNHSITVIDNIHQFENKPHPCEL